MLFYLMESDAFSLGPPHAPNRRSVTAVTLPRHIATFEFDIEGKSTASFVCCGTSELLVLQQPIVTSTIMPSKRPGKTDAQKERDKIRAKQKRDDQRDWFTSATAAVQERNNRLAEVRDENMTLLNQIDELETRCWELLRFLIWLETGENV